MNILCIHTYTHRELNQWKLKRLPLLETEFMNLAIDKEKELELKTNNEVKMVKEKLHVEFEIKRKALLNDNEATMGVSNMHHKYLSYD